MSEIHALVPREASTSLPTSSEWRTMVEMAGMLVPTKFLPDTIRTPEQAVAIILKGRELRVPPMQALSQIVVVQGKPVCSAELMLALIYRDHGDLAVVVEESTPEACRVSYRRRAWDAPRAFAFTLEDARRAGLAGKGTWLQYPQAMLRARCVSAVARLAFPDSIAGMYTPEELGATVRVTEDGAVEIDHRPAPLPPSTRAPAIAADIDAALDEADALVATPLEEVPVALPETGELPGPRWGTSPLGQEVEALWAQLEKANERRTAARQHPIHHLMPADRATDDEVRQWLASKQRALKAMEPAR